jgi:hypothetical protein
MCEYYLDICKEPECIAAEEAKDPPSWNLFWSRSGWKGVLWRGYEEPCDHIKASNPDWREEMEEARGE